MSRKRSRSSLSKNSTVSKKEVIEKLNKLSLEEEKILKERDDLMKFLESRSSSVRTTSRMTTVSSLMSSRPLTKQIEIPTKKSPQKHLKIIEEAQKLLNHKGSQARVPSDPVGDLIKNID